MKDIKVSDIKSRKILQNSANAFCNRRCVYGNNIDMWDKNGLGRDVVQIRSAIICRMKFVFQCDNA